MVKEFYESYIIKRMNVHLFERKRKGKSILASLNVIGGGPVDSVKSDSTGTRH